MSFAKAKRENKKIEARQEKRDLEDKYKALEVTCLQVTTVSLDGRFGVTSFTPSQSRQSIEFASPSILQLA